MDDLESTATAANSNCIGTLLICPDPHLLEMTFLLLAHGDCVYVQYVQSRLKRSRFDAMFQKRYCSHWIQFCFLLLAFVLLSCLLFQERRERLIGLIRLHFSECITSHSSLTTLQSLLVTHESLCDEPCTRSSKDRHSK